ncbi:MAG: hypothetical protein KAH25_06885 [Bacteroidales bacterium]|nr:hypothetical protein [Bacteroidales bacterium]
MIGSGTKDAPITVEFASKFNISNTNDAPDTLKSVAFYLLNSWYESGYVRDVTIKNNKFIYCGSPVINIHPENSSIEEGNPVHKNISIIGNQFRLKKDLLLSSLR